MVVRKKIDVSAPPTDEQVEMLRRAAQMPFVPDKDCPEFTAEELKQFRRVSEINRSERKKQTITLRLSPKAIDKAKSLGKGYTSVLSRVLESVLNDNEAIKKYL